MARIFVETWSPEYGAPLDPDEALAPAEGSVDDTVETAEWAPRDGRDDGVDRVAFVDGVRRVDARLTIDDPLEGPLPGICGTFAVGAVVWDRAAPGATVEAERVERVAVLGGGRSERDLGEHAVQEAIAEAGKRLLDPLDIAQVGAEADDHRAESISWRILRTLASSPVKIASPIRKWPMLSSANWGIAATGATLSKTRPWPAWGSIPFLAARAAMSVMRFNSATCSSPSAWA
jgi:hypothetical protein